MSTYISCFVTESFITADDDPRWLLRKKWNHEGYNVIGYRHKSERTPNGMGMKNRWYEEHQSG